MKIDEICISEVVENKNSDEIAEYDIENHICDIADPEYFKDTIKELFSV